MAKIDTNYTEEQIRKYAERDILIGSRISGGLYYTQDLDYTHFIDQGYMSGCIIYWGGSQSESSTFVYSDVRNIAKLPHGNKRIIGVIKGINADGSLRLHVLGNNIKINVGDVEYIESKVQMKGRAEYNTVDQAKYNNFPIPITWKTSDDLLFTGQVCANQRVYGGYTSGETAEQNFRPYGYWSAFFKYGCLASEDGVTYEGNAPFMHDRAITIGRTNFGCFRLGIENRLCTGYIGDTDFNKSLYGNHVYENISGDILGLMQGVNNFVSTGLNAMQAPEYFERVLYSGINQGTTGGCFNWEPYNLILTHSESQALEYLDTGKLPDDANIKPLDPDDIPPTAGVGADVTSPDDEPGENGDNSKDTDPTPTVTPTVTPQLITTNNLYWLQAGELTAFINWFWQDVGQIVDIDDLLKKIQGYYNDLASTILNVRYMPINISWVGGASTVPGINLGMLTKAGQVDQINRTNPTVRTIGSINITEKYKSFCDYSPYSNIILYLPFHGMVELDNDLFMGETLTVKAIYDIISGTIQYFIYCNDFMTNSFIAQMAVDIPITLQSKADRDSAIFSNVANATANAIGAGMSAAAGNPIGLVMSTASATQGGQHSAPYKLLATQGESGAFYAPQKCAIYVKKPSYNRPKNYGGRVGYPCNKQYKLSSLSGFTACYNPYVSFTHEQKPLQSEIDEIYSLLEKGVIL